MSVTIPLHSLDEERLLFGERDKFARAIRNRFNVTLNVRKGRASIGGEKDDDVSDAARVVRQLLEVIRNEGELSESAFDALLDAGRGAGIVEDVEADRRGDGGLWLPNGMRPKNRGQEQLVRTMMRETATICIGPAGTGKTYMAGAVAITGLKRGYFRKLVLVRPAVEAGESLGFLPGDYVAKINPYLRPLYDALSAHLEPGRLQQLIDTEVIEIAPLAYMRGRTLDEAFIILDEAQNTTTGQMKLFLTRMGRNSKVVVTGDVTQVDLSDGQPSGLSDAVSLLRNVSGIGVVELDSKDIVRHPLVQKIVSAYEQRDRDQNGRGRVRGPWKPGQGSQAKDRRGSNENDEGREDR